MNNHETQLDDGEDFYLAQLTSCWVRMGNKSVFLSRHSGTVRVYEVGSEGDAELACVDLMDLDVMLEELEDSTDD